MKTKLGLVVLALALVLNFQSASAVPSFSRAEQLSCSACHTIYPQLNSVGRDYKTGGYSFASSVDLGDNTVLEGTFPVSARLNMRLIDKRTSKKSINVDLNDGQTQLKMRSLHEVEIFMAGKASPRMSYFAELESEDEWPDPDGAAPGYQVQVVAGVIQFALNGTTNLHAGFGTPFWADPYNTVHYRKPVRHAWAPASKGFTPGRGQFVSLSSRISPSVFALVAWHGNTGGAGQLEGKDPKNFSGRIAFDVTPTVTVGAFGTSAKAYDPIVWKSVDKTTTWGVDFQAELGSANVHGLYGSMKDDVANTTETTYGVEFNMSTEANGMKIGPVVSLSSYTQADGADRFTQAGLFLSCQNTGNIRTQLGWEGSLSLPDRYLHKESRITFVVDVTM